jgi:hypothetical protein
MKILMDIIILFTGVLNSIAEINTHQPDADNAAEGI